MAIQSYRDLKVWQKAMELVAACYEFTQRLPESEMFGLTADIRRRVRQIPASVSDLIPDSRFPLPEK